LITVPAYKFHNQDRQCPEKRYIRAAFQRKDEALTEL